MNSDIFAAVSSALMAVDSAVSFACLALSRRSFSIIGFVAVAEVARASTDSVESRILTARKPMVKTGRRNVKSKLGKERSRG